MEADESQPHSALSLEKSVPAPGAVARPQRVLHPFSLGTVAPGLGCYRGPGGGPTTLPARAVIWDAHMYEGMGLLLHGMALLPLGDAVLVFQFVLQLHGGSGHFCLKNCSCRRHGSREAIRHAGGRDPKESFQPAVYKVNT